jgi:hypothetical protein
MNVGLAAVEPKGLRIRDEVDVVPAGGKLDAQLGGDDAGAAVRRVTGNADLQGARFARWGWFGI